MCQNLGLLQHEITVNVVECFQVIERNVETVRTEQKDKRQDLFAMAYSYSGQLKNKKSVMILESEFHVVTKRPVRSNSIKSILINFDQFFFFSSELMK